MKFIDLVNSKLKPTTINSECILIFFDYEGGTLITLNDVKASTYFTETPYEEFKKLLND